jgi:hypothetical protein
LLRTGLGTRLERWEMTRKIPKLTAASVGSEVLLGPNQCKGHVSAHQAWVYERFTDRIAWLNRG